MLGASAPTIALSAVLFDTQASGVFVDTQGTVLTVAHGLAGCATPLVAYQGQVYPATRRAVDSKADLALLDTPALGLLAARWAPAVAAVGAPVFTASYGRLMSNDTMTLTNALVVAAEPSALVLVSAARPGASGAPVLDDRGAVVGLVRARRARPGTAGGRVEAIGLAPIERFLTAQNVAVPRARDRQLAVTQPKAGRARTLTAGILCGS